MLKPTSKSSSPSWFRSRSLSLVAPKGVAPPSITMGQVYAAAAPFIVLEIIVLALIVLFPEIATWLPSAMRG